MALPSSGNPISFFQIASEFGSTSGNKLGGYRYSQTINGSGLTLPLDTGIPTSGTIRFSDFYDKRLNIVVDCFSGETQTAVNAKTDKWDSNDTIVVSGWGKSRKEEGSRIRIAVNKKIGSAKGSTNKCALRTGSWDASSLVVVDISANGKLLGAGGDGGRGANGIADNGEPGGDGASGLGIEHNNTVVNVYSGGTILQGYGGGGGGGGGRETSKNDRRAGGGGGGGGAGFPIGLGGAGGVPQSGTDASSAGGSAGDNATETTKGVGRGGGDNDDQAGGGRGGNGADNEETTAEAGVDAATQGHTKPPGSRGLGGSNGAAIRTTSGSISFTFGVNSGTVTGSTSATGVD